MSAATASASFGIRVNDEPRTVTVATTVAELVRELGLAEKKGIAVAVNNTVVPRTGWAARALSEGDRVLVIRATQGG